MKQQSKKKSEPQRLQSLDALRGFDMFWIMGVKISSSCWVQSLAYRHCNGGLVRCRMWNGTVFMLMI